MRVACGVKGTEHPVVLAAAADICWQSGLPGGPGCACLPSLYHFLRILVLPAVSQEIANEVSITASNVDLM